MKTAAVQIGDDILEVSSGELVEQGRVTNYWVNGKQGKPLIDSHVLPFTIGGHKVRFRVPKAHQVSVLGFPFIAPPFSIHLCLPNKLLVAVAIQNLSGKWTKHHFESRERIDESGPLEPPRTIIWKQPWNFGKL